MTDTLVKKTSIGLIWASTNVVLSAILKIIVLAILGRLLLPYDFGIAAAALVIIQFVLIFGELGIGAALIQKKNIDNKHIDVAFTFSLCVGTIISILVFLSSSLFANFFNMQELEKVVKVISVVILIRSFILVTESEIYKKLELKKITIIKISSYFLGYGIPVPILAYMGFSYWSLVIGTISQYLIESIFLLINSDRIPKLYISWNKLKELLSFGAYFSVSRFFMTLCNQGDNFIIAKLLGSDALGLYSRAYQMYMLPVQLLGTTFNKTLFPSFSLVQNDLTKIYEIYKNTVFVISLICYPTIILLIYSSNNIVKIVLGSNWLELVLTLQILFVSLNFRIGYKIVDTILNAIGRVKEKAFLQAIYAVLLLSLGIYGTQWGIEGVSVGLTIAVFIHYLLMNILLIRVLKGNYFSFIKLQLLGLFFMLITYACIYVVYDSYISIDNPIYSLILNFILFGALMITLYIIFHKKIKENAEWSFSKIEKFKSKKSL